ncbi:AAA family ATPase [Calothrix sp. FACHB-1219]|uniref:AAA family ATPase n=1 Tax=unclassified Calothrix TaxID=2619626 RepID=UPI0016884A99|nr:MULTISPECIES: AAA family ATPase [unclassified Calothrix]MBD2205580.1 AAA family ATPase [Calothrix sp. FACHB-168]MBD2220243.1 AAA family ATPase [Calothrix sp. FACHB-1219]
MNLSQLNLLIDSGIHIVCVTASISERMTVLKQIHQECAVNRNLPMYLWNAGWGCFKQVQFDSERCVSSPTVYSSKLQPRDDGIFAAFDDLLNSEIDGVFIFENLQSLIKQDSTLYLENYSLKITSQIINIYYELKNPKNRKYFIILSLDEVELPQSLTQLIPNLSMPLPSHEIIADFIKEFLFNQITDFPKDFDLSVLVNAASGLTLEEIRSGCAIAINSCPEFHSNTIALHLLDYKINRFRAFNLNFVSHSNVADFGGLDLLKKFLENVKLDFAPEARSANIPLPKGCLLVGPPGTGKTLAAHVSAKTLGFPLVCMDTAAVVSGSATHLKRLLERIEACAPVVLYFDELDKLFAASTPSGEDIDSRRILGTLLTWLQEKQSAVFVVASLNRLDALPPELTRVGRFDEIFYVGFPQAIERKEILMMHLARFDERYRNGGDRLTEKEWRILLNKTINCNGAELARMVEKAARALFHQRREIHIGLSELLEQREMIVPLYVRDTDRILAIENRAKYICQPASTKDSSVFAPAITTYWGEPCVHS